MNEMLIKISKLDVQGNTLRVLLFMLAHANEKNINIKQAEISRELNLTQPNTVRAIKELKDNNIIFVEKCGRNNKYKLV